ncbi:vascular endothelial growth factor receptor kdr-like [Copidosoma floridanum]|uniref:vascular endothelial growth factor receptor kdr-like n=1 Tax=Copidosoma floridanum TaxID=29053 RepID=UPI000C6F93C4|nr:vascular endothelial growth factor receptor kdr-like [Copidosoma floridanum]
MSISSMQVKRNLLGVKQSSKKWLDLFLILHWTALFLNIFLFLGCTGDKPQLHPNVTELEINEGEALKIKCTSNEYVKFYYPDPYHLGSIMMSDYDIYPKKMSTEKTFLKESTLIGDSGCLTCKAYDGDITTKTMKFSISYNNGCMSKPTAKIEGRQTVFVGSSLTVTCRVEVYVESSYIISWKTPQNSIQVAENENNDSVTSKLIIRNVTYADEGNYTCQVRSSYKEHRSTNIFIEVHDPNSYISLTSNNRDLIDYSVGLNVYLTVNIDAYPPPTISWLTSNGTEIVFEKPRVILYQAELKSFYSLNESATFACQATGHPAPNISWFYKMCPDYSVLFSMYTCKTVEMEGKQSRNGTYSELKVNMESFGKITCEACHAYDCDSKEYKIQITDGVDNAPYGIIGPEEAYNGENITLICAAVKHNHLSVTWLDDQFQEITNSAKEHVTSKKTNFTIRKELVIYNISQSDEKDYHCSVMSDTKSTKIIRYHVNYKLCKEPYFTRDNMNSTSAIVLTPDARNIIYLFCFVGGSPRPNITWYKDDALLNLSEDRLSLVFNNQKLIIRYPVESDSGNYSCRAENRFGRIEKNRKINVTGKQISTFCFITILILLSVYFCLKVQHEKIMRKQQSEVGLAYFKEGAVDLINPELKLNEQAEYLPYDEKWEFSRENLKLGEQLGSGAFGVVVKAEAFGICATEPVTSVAVKMVHENAEPVYIRALVRELKIMMNLGQHLNVVNLLGACTKNIAKREFLVILESCAYGNLEDFLRYHRENFVDQINPFTGHINLSINQKLMETFPLPRLRTPTILLSSVVPLTVMIYNQVGVLTTKAIIKTRMLNVSAPMTSSLGLISDANFSFTKAQNSNDSIEFRSASYCDDLQPSWRSNYEGNYQNWNAKCIWSHDLLSWAYQVAHGMEYLSRRNVLHCDLAARNVLLSTNNIVKICDFGLAQTLYKDINYTRLHDVKLPYKWMAIESLRDGVFSTKSDIWSFGIVIWEFFTLAETPYLGMQASVVYQKLINGYRMGQPRYATKYLYNIMLNCWEDEPTLRPSFTELSKNIGMLLDKSTRAHFEKLYQEYENINKEVDVKRENDYSTNMSSPDKVALALPQQNYENRLLHVENPIYLCLNNND